MNTTSGLLAHELALAFHHFGPSLRKWMTAGATPTTLPRLGLLRVLATDGPQIMSALSDTLGVTPRNITVLVDGLESEGLAQRTPHPNDRRATLVELTPQGRTTIAGAFEAHVKRVAELFERLTPQEQSTLLVLIRKLTDELADLGVVGPCGPPVGSMVTASDNEAL
jgi:DNA-binding MarR family transcriptional regulator